MRKLRHSATDFVEESLPGTRREQYFDVIRMEWRTLFRVGLSMFLFFLPLAALMLFKASYSETLMNLVAEQGGGAEPLYRLILNLGFDGAYLFAAFVASFGVAGNLRVLRNLAWGEGVIYWADFREGIRRYWKAALLALLMTVLIIVLNHGLTFLLEAYAPKPLDVILVVVVDFIDAFLLLPAAIVAMSLQSVYELGFGKTISSAFSLLMRSYLLELPLLAFIILMNFALRIPGIYLGAIIYAVGAIFVSPFFLLLSRLAHTYWYDKLINEPYPEIRYKGLYIPKDESKEK